MSTPIITYDSLSRALNAHITRQGEWCGMPMPFPGERLTIEPKNPWREKIELCQAIVDSDRRPSLHVDRDEDIDDQVGFVNEWYSKRLRCYVLVYRDRKGVSYTLHTPDAGRVGRILIHTLGVSQVRSVETETVAMSKLAELIKPHLFEAYQLTGTFIETSSRSGLTYMFRRARPTLVASPHTPNNEMKWLTALCLHPIGYYKDTFAGSMVPTDEVIAHLMLMRGDEKLYWRRANQHPVNRPEAGLY